MCNTVICFETRTTMYSEMPGVQILEAPEKLTTFLFNQLINCSQNGLPAVINKELSWVFLERAVPPFLIIYKFMFFYRKMCLKTLFVFRDVERKDVTNVLEMHIFITQFFHKFDLRTTMLYICENHFQRLCRRSMFTGN